MPELLPIDLVPKSIYFGEGTSLEYLAYYGPEISMAHPSEAASDQEIEEVYHAILGSHLFCDGKNIKYTQTPSGTRSKDTMILEKTSGSPVKGLNVTSPGFTVEFWVSPGYISNGLQYFGLALHGWTGKRWGEDRYCSMNFELQKELQDPMSYSLQVGGQSVASSNVSILGWSHIAICFNSGSVKLYLDGELFISNNQYKEEFRDMVLMKTFLLDLTVLDHIEKTWLLDSNGNRLYEIESSPSISQPTYIRSIRFTTDDRYKEDFAPPIYMEA
jgi:hypothetical protein